MKSFNPNNETILVTDASDKGLGALLVQMSEGEEKLIACASRCLKGAEYSYSVVEKESLAIHWAINKFRNFLWGIQFPVRSDHKPLVSIFRNKGLDSISTRIRRWVMSLQDFNFIVNYIPGAVNVSADCLSRLVDQTMEHPDGSGEESYAEVCNVCEVTEGIITEGEWVEQLKADDSISKVMVQVKKGKKLDSLKPWNMVWHELTVERDILMRGTRLIPPESLRTKLIEKAHIGHLGIVKTKERLRMNFWWPGMDMAIERQVRDCTQCITSDKPLRTKQPPMVCRRLPRYPWDELSMDIIGPIRGELKTPYLIVLEDLYSRWVEVTNMSEVSSKKVIDFLTEIFKKESFTNYILTDNGPQFI